VTWQNFNDTDCGAACLRQLRFLSLLLCRLAFYLLLLQTNAVTEVYTTLLAICRLLEVSTRIQLIRRCLRTTTCTTVSVTQPCVSLQRTRSTQFNRCRRVSGRTDAQTDRRSHGES